MLRMSRRPLSGGRTVFQPAVINECCRPSLNTIQTALPNLRIISGALLSSPQHLETCDFKDISALRFFFFFFPNAFLNSVAAEGSLRTQTVKAIKSRTKSSALVFFNLLSFQAVSGAEGLIRGILVTSSWWCSNCHSK